jgi:bifunctional non-homologous end joining protein LigD
MLRRTPSARFWRNLPAGFIQPCQPTLVAAPPAGPGWLHEMKHDGFRILARKQGERVEVWSRRGTLFNDRFPRIAEAVGALPVDNALIDGEAVVFLPDGHSDFAALRTKDGGQQAAFVAFNLLDLEGDDLRQHPLEERREALAHLVAGVDDIRFSEALAAEGALVFARARELGLEGIVSKRAGSRYRSGVSPVLANGSRHGVRLKQGVLEVDYRIGHGGDELRRLRKILKHLPDGQAHIKESAAPGGNAKETVAKRGDKTLCGGFCGAGRAAV